MSYKFKSDKIIIEGKEFKIKPISLPVSPVDGYCAIDIVDNKFKVWNSTLNRWIVVGDAVDAVFDNDNNGFESTDVQSAIEEAKNTAVGRLRWMANCGFDGGASTGRYLEYNSNVDSNQSGLVIPLPCKLKELTLVINTASTVTFTVYKWNGSTETALTTISTTNSRHAITTNLNISLAADAEIRVKCTSGSGSRPIMYQYFQND